LVAYFAVYRTSENLAGRSTIADIGMKILADFSFSWAAPCVIATGAVVYGWRQRALRHKTIKRLGEGRREYERALDPSRTSSELHPDGTTRSEDKQW
jgi:hypothetical protein